MWTNALYIMYVLLHWLYIHTGQAWKIYLATVGFEPTTFGMLAWSGYTLRVAKHTSYSPEYIISWQLCIYFGTFMFCKIWCTNWISNTVQLVCCASKPVFWFKRVWKMQNLDNVCICGSLCYEQIIDMIKV